MSRQWVFTVGLSSSVVVDILITASLLVILRRSRTGYSTRYLVLLIPRFHRLTCHSTDRIIDSITLYTVETGMITWSAP